MSYAGVAWAVIIIGSITVWVLLAVLIIHLTGG